MICKHCGYEIPDTAKFCRSCGKPQAADVPLSTAPAPAPTSTPAPHLAAPIPAVESNLVTYLAVSIAFIASVGGVGYWGWTQRVLAEEQKVTIAKFQAEEAERKAKIQAEEARLKKEAEDKVRQEVEAEKFKKEQEERDAKVAEASAVLKWTGRYQCSELLLQGAKVRNEFAVDIAFTTTSGKGIFLRQTNDLVEKFNVSINAGNVEIASEGSRIADPTKKWFVRTKGTLVGSNINTIGSMFGADGQQLIRQTCKIQVTK